ncbi:bifunctional ornithine acetyltransferase/N-acetylglutamate synthase [Methanobacterium petrolearium]|uniref:bifunctional ornithine acetyltransferase/N-acetylglutamate synthase n=1 Tax=Methanobacterium petrolearium TaxID=710190 RepID=UPI001AE95011|nr:bifunctional ornithine acetyltransferase/N-acetylglutamate synthase [Methanobacterium petrolearium]MBP1945322.1 glutamate N-acetyltransferase/amino-acid N-acetyltransferase [Methanobacterium petrolearium]BDZ71504.1 bifunctional ornithine acetyltransferase/N-acetylglutamate synthase [Methanobacterium petrolearium]
MKKIEGGICAVDNVRAAGACEDNYGVAVIHYPESSVAAVFTSNKVQAAPILVTREAVKNGKLSAIVANSGNANCFTGKKGVENAQLMAFQAAENLNIPAEDVAVASTGIIGRQLPLPEISNLISHALRRLKNSAQASRNAAEAIMTTDTYPKEYAVETTLNTGEKICIGGITKGSGMIAPNMGTMLSFIVTDIQASPDELEKSLKEAVDNTFNMVVIDGDESTNDIVVLMARPGQGKIDKNFQEALEYLCGKLAKMLAQDGEGATKFMEVEVKGAQNSQDAKIAAKSIVTSPLVKTALFGADPNWGRIVAAVGYSGAHMDEEIISVRLEDGERFVDVVNNGNIMASEENDALELAESIMEREKIKITIDLALGDYSATSYGCDLSYDYVRINSEYST